MCKGRINQKKKQQTYNAITKKHKNDLDWTPLHNNQIIKEKNQKKRKDEKIPKKQTCKQSNPTHKKEEEIHLEIVEMSKL